MITRYELTEIQVRSLGSELLRTRMSIKYRMKSERMLVEWLAKVDSGKVSGMLSARDSREEDFEDNLRTMGRCS